MARADSSAIVAGLPLSQSEPSMNALLLLPNYNKFNKFIDYLQHDLYNQIKQKYDLKKQINQIK